MIVPERPMADRRCGSLASTPRSRIRSQGSQNGILLLLPNPKEGELAVYSSTRHCFFVMLASSPPKAAARPPRPVDALRLPFLDGSNNAYNASKKSSFTSDRWRRYQCIGMTTGGSQLGLLVRILWHIAEESLAVRSSSISGISLLLLVESNDIQ